METKVVKAESVREILTLKNRYGKTAAFCAGGTSFELPGSDSDYEILLDLCGARLKFINPTEIGIEIGACISFSEALQSDYIPRCLRNALQYADSEELRQRATLGGNIGRFRNDSYLLPVLIAAKARVITMDLDEEGVLIEESVPIREFVEHHDLYRYTLVTKLCLDKPRRFASSERFIDPDTGRHVLSLGFGTDYQAATDRVENTRIAIGTAGCDIYRLIRTEQALDQGAIQTPKDLAYAVEQEISVISDETGTAAYKQELAGRAVAKAFEKCLLEYR